MYSEVLIGISFAIASYQDVRERAVSDLVWLPAVAGVMISVALLYPFVEFQLAKVALVGGIALVFTLFGFIGQADAIAMAVIAAEAYPLSPIPALVAAAVVALSHIGYEFAVGNARGKITVPMEKFLREQRWIPKAVLADGVRTEVTGDVNVAREEVAAMGKLDGQVEVGYGVPTVAYLGIGYLAFIAYLLLFDMPAFFSLP